MMRVWCALLRVIAQILLLILITLSTDVSHRTTKEIYVKEGEIAVLSIEGCDLWKSSANKGMHLNRSMPAAEQRQMGLLVKGDALVILSASVKHQGNYSCSLKNSSKWISLKVYTAQSREYEETQEKTCYTHESCTLYCSEKHEFLDTLNITRNSSTWQKEGESSPSNGYFSSVKKEDSGIYNCTWSYLYDGQLYNITATVKLDVQPSENSKKSVIISPKDNQIFDVDLHSMVVIDCKAVMYSESDKLLWLCGTSFVEVNSSLPVFYNYTRSASVSDHKTKEFKETASLVFRRVSEDDLTKRFICKLHSYHEMSFVTITLKQKARRSYTSLGVCIVSIVVVMVVTVVIYVKFKVDITLFIRDTLRYSGSTSDGKCYDSFLMCYKCNTAGGLNAHDARWLESVLEERFGYSLCLYDRDVLPGKAITEAVLDCIEQSRTVVLVPVSTHPDLESGLLTAIHEALVERQTRLIFITTETTATSRSDSFPEALQLLNEAADCVTWKGKSSMPTSSSFWKQLRYYLPVPQRAAKVKLLPKTIQDVTS
ncbi:interleukin-18 receptor 1-like [Archocentrus centrarchus]|uniref:interleukin-18 receptor 1-like n=1 Tax=Archocentrus centrarchus TaxID=63155 RepID=UPI0011E9C46C|nr:interleukin-18 receptor 1-like [Archocentrus centrarchus]